MGNLINYPYFMMIIRRFVLNECLYFVRICTHDSRTNVKKNKGKKKTTRKDNKET